jgi:hypothetical protein
LRQGVDIRGRVIDARQELQHRDLVRRQARAGEGFRAREEETLEVVAAQGQEALVFLGGLDLLGEDPELCLVCALDHPWPGIGRDARNFQLDDVGAAGGYCAALDIHDIVQGDGVAPGAQLAHPRQHRRVEIHALQYLQHHLLRREGQEVRLHQEAPWQVDERRIATGQGGEAGIGADGQHLRCRMIVVDARIDGAAAGAAEQQFIGV